MRFFLKKIAVGCFLSKLKTGNERQQTLSTKMFFFSVEEFKKFKIFLQFSFIFKIIFNELFKLLSINFRKTVAN